MVRSFFKSYMQYMAMTKLMPQATRTSSYENVNGNMGYPGMNPNFGKTSPFEIELAPQTAPEPFTLSGWGFGITNCPSVPVLIINLTDTSDTRNFSTGENVQKWTQRHHAIFFSFSDASERRVWLSAESKILASTFERFRLYRLRLTFLFRALSRIK